MKKLSNKIKTIYMLTAIIILSFCMFLFSILTKPASADEIADAANNLQIKSTYIQVSNQVNEDNEISEFAIMFKAKIDLDNYNVITNNGRTAVKFGMLIGPSEKMINVTDYDSAREQDFVEVATVGTASSGASQRVNFGDAKEYSYVAGIVYNEEYLQELGVDVKVAVETELTAIPLYILDGVPYALINNQKSCTPRHVLAESFIKEQENAIINIPESVFTTYVGEITEITGEHYICRDSARLMSSEVVGGDLLAVNASDTTKDAVYIDGKKQSSSDTTAFDLDTMETLPKNGSSRVIVYKESGEIIKYTAKVAERVITRFADRAVGQTLTDETKDYLATATSSGYDSIFQISSTTSNLSSYTFIEAGATFELFKQKYDGLYVLANDIKMETSHTYKTDKGGDYTNLLRPRATDGNYTGIKSQYAAPIANAGFTGTFDGRGNVIDVNKRASYGVLPPAFGATIKNTAFLNLSSGYNGGGIVSTARNTTFDNIYVEITSVSNYSGDNRNPIGMYLQDCSLNNVVFNVNASTETVMTKELTYGLSNVITSQSKDSGAGQGKTTSGVFSFVRFPDMYYDEVTDKVYTISNPSLQFKDFDTNGGYNYFEYKVQDDPTTMKVNMYSSDTKDVFVGTTATNVYVVGNSPLFLIHEGGVTVENFASLAPTTKTTVFVNQMPKYNSGDAENPVYEDTNSTDYYKLSSLLDTDGMFTINNDTTYSLGEIILRGKQYRYGVDEVATMLATEGTNELEVRLVTKAGFYDVKDTTEMATYVNANAETPFDSTYWNVSDGIVNWKGLSS